MNFLPVCIVKMIKELVIIQAASSAVIRSSESLTSAEALFPNDEGIIAMRIKDGEDRKMASNQSPST